MPTDSICYFRSQRYKPLVWRPANNFLKAVESESQFFRAKAADKPSKIVKLFAGRDTSGRSEFFIERADFEFHRPRTRILVREMPVGLCDCVGLEKVAVLQTRLQSTRSRDVDATIHVDPRDVDASRTKVARE